MSSPYIRVKAVSSSTVRVSRQHGKDKLVLLTPVAMSVGVQQRDTVSAWGVQGSVRSG